MADFTQSKNELASQMVTLAAQTLHLLAALDELNAAFNVHGFNEGGQNAYVDADFLTTNTHLSASVVADCLFAIGTLATAANIGVRNSLREVLVGALE